MQELRGQGEFLAGLLAEHQSLLRRQDTCGEHVATACITSPATYSAIPTRASLSRLGRRHNCFRLQLLLLEDVGGPTHTPLAFALDLLRGREAGGARGSRGTGNPALLTMALLTMFIIKI